MSRAFGQLASRKGVGFVMTIVTVLVLSACGIGEDDEDLDPTEPAGVLEIPTETLEDPDSTAPPTSPSSPPDDGTPAGDGTPSPSVVVSAPTVAIPTMTPTSAAATPTPGGPQTDVEVPAAAVGDGTGGAVVVPTAANPGASPVSEQTQQRGFRDQSLPS